MGQVQSGSPGHVFREPDHSRFGSRRNLYRPSGRPSRLRCAHRKNGLDIPHVPRPGEYGYDTWPPDAWKYAGGNNTWSEFAIDAKRGIAYFPLGSPTYDLYGADRIGADLFRQLSTCARCANRQTDLALPDRHHDLWDYDLVDGPSC